MEHVRAGRRGTWQEREGARSKPFRFGVQIVGMRLGAGRGATRRASSKTSATRRCSCPTTSATGARADAGDRDGGRGTRRRCASARSCSTTTTSTRRSSPRSRDHRRAVATAALELGIGAGWMKADYDGARPAVRPARRADRPVRRGARRSSRVLDGRGRSRIDGEHYRSRDYDVDPEARAEAASADPHRRRRAQACCASPAREADIVGINPNLRGRRDQPPTR